MKDRSKNQNKLPRLNAWESRVHSENATIDKLRAVGIWAQPGKACSAPHVDVVARGCVQIEVKYARLPPSRGGKFVFMTTPAQADNGLRGDLVLLVCDYGDERGCTYHLFSPDHDVFYMHPNDPARRRLKTGITYEPGRTKHKHEGNRVLLTDELMRSAQDAWQMIDEVRSRIEARIMQGLPPR